MTTGKLDFGDLIETIGTAKLDELVVGGSYIAAVIATLPAPHSAMVSHMLVDALEAQEDRLPIMSRFVMELVANSIANKRFADWAHAEIVKSLN